MQSDKKISIKAKFPHNNVNKIWKFSQVDLTLFDKQCKRVYDGYCDLTYTFLGKTQIEIDNPQTFAKIVRQRKGDRQLIFRISVVGGIQKYESIKHLIGKKQKEQKQEIPTTDLKKESNSCQQEKEKGKQKLKQSPNSFQDPPKQASLKKIQSKGSAKQQLPTQVNNQSGVAILKNERGKDINLHQSSEQNLSLLNQSQLMRSYTKEQQQLSKKRKEQQAAQSKIYLSTNVAIQQNNFLKRPSNKQKNQKQNYIDKIIEIYNKTKNIQQFKLAVNAHLNSQVRRRVQEHLNAQSKIHIAQNLTCFGCKNSNFKGPVYECLICPQKIYFCSVCEATSQMSNHIRSHPMAKIKYISQFIKEKNVKTVKCQDIQLSDSDDEEQKIIKAKPIKQQKGNKKQSKQEKIEKVEKTEKVDKVEKEVKVEKVGKIEKTERPAQKKIKKIQNEQSSKNINKDLQQRQNKLNKKQIVLSDKKQQGEIIKKKEMIQGPNQKVQGIQKIKNSKEKSQNNKQISNRQAKENRNNEKRPLMVYKEKLLNPLTEYQKSRKRNSLKILFNATNQQVEKYMRGQLEYMDYRDIMDYLASSGSIN